MCVGIGVGVTVGFFVGVGVFVAVGLGVTVDVGFGVGVLVGVGVLGFVVGVGVAAAPCTVTLVGVRFLVTSPAFPIAAVCVPESKLICVAPPDTFNALKLMLAIVPVPCFGSEGKLPRIIEAVPGPTCGPGGKTIGKNPLSWILCASRIFESKAIGISVADTLNVLVFIIISTEKFSLGERLDLLATSEKSTPVTAARLRSSCLN